jgi:hypothetical protein
LDGRWPCESHSRALPPTEEQAGIAGDKDDIDVIALGALKIVAVRCSALRWPMTGSTAAAPHLAADRGGDSADLAGRRSTTGAMRATVRSTLQAYPAKNVTRLTNENHRTVEAWRAGRSLPSMPPFFNLIQHVPCCRMEVQRVLRKVSGRFKG